MKRLSYVLISFFTLSLLTGVLNAAEPNASGQLIVNEKPSKLQYAYASVEPGFFDKKTGDVVVILSDIPLSDKAIEDWGERLTMAQEGKLHSVELTINANKELISRKVRHNGFKASPSGRSTDEVLELKTFDGKVVEGKISCKKQLEFFGTPFRYDATFKVNIKEKQKSS